MQTQNESAVNDAARSVSVEIYDQIYHLRGTDPEHIQTLAAMVDTKMRTVSAHGATADSLRVAVLAALNLADELWQMKQHQHDLMDSRDRTENTMRGRADSLAGMLDEVLGDRIAV